MKIGRITFPEDNGEKAYKVNLLDEVVVTDVESVHLERMSDEHFVLVLSQGGGGGRICVNLWTKANAVIHGRVEIEDVDGRNEELSEPKRSKR